MRIYKEEQKESLMKVACNKDKIKIFRKKDNFDRKKTKDRKANNTLKRDVILKK